MDTNKIILDIVKKEKNIVYGARSIQRQTGIVSRPTSDWDIFSNKPKISATKTEQALDKASGKNLYYVKPALHAGTYKVEYIGKDNKKGTKDDIGIADFTTMPKPKPTTINLGGILYRKLSGEKKAKMKALKDPTQEFRHAKDQDDYNRIELGEAMELNPKSIIGKFNRRVRF